MNYTWLSSSRLLTVAVVMWALLSRQAARAFVAHRPTVSLVARRPMMLSTASPVDLDKLNQQIKEKGDEIRALKGDGVSKDDLAPHVQELLSLKAQLPEKEQPQPKKETKPKKERNAQTVKPVEEMSESELRLNRLAKVQVMKDAGVEPFEYTYSTSHTANELLQLYDGHLEGGEEDEAADVSVAGRIMTRRVFGKLAFFTLQDGTGTIQLQFDKNRLSESFKVS